jgi:hypothetical protein
MTCPAKLNHIVTAYAILGVLSNLTKLGLTFSPEIANRTDFLLKFLVLSSSYLRLFFWKGS